jgi:hypothetical protein
MIKLTEQRGFAPQVLVHPDDNVRASKDENCEETATCTSAILKALPVLPDLFVELVCGKDGIKNKCEQNYPASGRNDREHPYTSPAHALSFFRLRHGWLRAKARD